jgi:acyl-CoA reductase-like NAD-dependent aldehyde dehydrogenase
MAGEPSLGGLMIGGTWRAPASGATLDVEDPSTGDVFGVIGRGTEADIDTAVIEPPVSID